MTIKELAELTGKPKTTIRDIVKAIYPGRMESRKKTDLSDTECMAIIAEMQYAVKDQPRLNDGRSDLNALRSVDIESLIAKTVAETLRQVMPLIQSQAQKPLQIEYKFTTALAYCKQNGLSCDFDYVKSIGYKAAVYSRMHGLAVQKIPDARYGFVNGYTIDALEAAV